VAYALQIKQSAQVSLHAIPKKQRAQIEKKIMALADTPRPPGVKKLHGHLSDYYRIRSGDYRVIYVISDTPPIVIVAIVTDRKDAY
jgi:mRNA interferase RelE/StbE